MVGCFPTSFRKTYVINQNTKVNNPKKSSSPHSPRYSTIFGELNSPLTNGHARFVSEKNASRSRNEYLEKSPVIRIIQVSDNDRKEPKIEEKVEKPVADFKKINENKKFNQNGISSSSNSAVPRTNEKIDKKMKESEVGENIYEETVKIPPEIISEKQSSSQNQRKSDQTKLKDDPKRLQESLYHDVVIQEPSPEASETLKSDSENIYGTRAKIESLYEETGIYTKQNTIPQEPKAVRPDREPAKLPTEITERQITSTIEKSKPKKRRAPTIGENTNAKIETTPSYDKAYDSKLNGNSSESTYEESIYSDPISEPETWNEKERPSQSTIASRNIYDRRSGIQPVRYEVDDSVPLPVYPKSEE